MSKTTGRLSPARRLEQVRALLNSTGGVTIYDLAERLGISTRTALRYLAALEQLGDRIYDEREGHRKVWRLMPSARERSLSLTTSQMLSLFLSRRVFDFLEGTGFKEDLDDIFKQLEAHLKRKDFVSVSNLDRKLFDVGEARIFYEGRIEDINDVVTALIRENRLRVTHASVGRGQKSFLIDPYTLLVYKKGLYLVGKSHPHDAIRTFSFDRFKSVEWLKKESFAYPADYRPESVVEGAFGLIGGAPTQVAIRFDSTVARYIRRRQWHPTQHIEKDEEGVILRMEVSGTVELSSWVLGFGDKAEVLEPLSLRREVAQAHARAAARYA